MKRLFLSVMVLMCAAMVSAQDKVEADLSADIVNQ